MGQEQISVVGGSSPVGEGILVEVPGVGKVGADGVQSEITGESVLDGFFAGMARPAPARSEVSSSPSEYVAPPMTAEDGYEAVPDLLKGVDPTRDENEILRIVNFALEKKGIDNMADFARWMQRTALLARQLDGPEHRLLPSESEAKLVSRYISGWGGRGR